MQRPNGGTHRLTQICVWILCIFLIILPKGGIRMAGIPITWGYVLLGLVTLSTLPARAFLYKVRFTMAGLVVLICLSFFPIVYLYSYNVVGRGSWPFTVSTVTSLMVLPFLFLVYFPAFYPIIDGKLLARAVRFCILAAAIYGLAIWLVRPFMGHYFFIPYLTTNADDGSLEGTKMIARGVTVKLISAYNNGNLYGAATLILLPLFDRLAPQKWKYFLMRIVMLLTLSRTVWFGVILEQALTVGANLIQQIGAFPRIRLRALTQQITLMGLAAVGISVATEAINQNADFVLDRGLGGRVGSLAWFTYPTLLPSYPTGGFSEILFAGALGYYGVLGMLSIIAIFFSPLVVLAIEPKIVDDPYRRAAIKGLLLYSLITLSDAGMNYIPVMAFYWFAYMIVIFGWPKAFQAKVAEPVLVPMGATA